MTPPEIPRPTPLAVPPWRLFALAGGVALVAWSLGSLALILLASRDETPSLPAAGAALGALLLGAGAAWAVLARGLLIAEARAFLVRQERCSRLLVDNAADAVLTFTQDGKIVSFNPAASRIFGYSADEVIGKDVSLLLATGDVDSIEELLRRALQPGSSLPNIGLGSLFGRHQSGRNLPIELGVSQVIDEDRQIYIQVIRDLSERSLAERQRVLQFEVAHLLGADDPLDKVGPAVLETIGTYLMWPLGVFWTLDEAGVGPGAGVWQPKRPAASWSHGQRAGKVEAHLRAAAPAPDSRLAGEAWRQRQLQSRRLDPGSPLDERFIEAGLSMGLAWPVELPGRFLGVLEFYLPNPVEVDDGLLRCLFPLATQMAQYLERQRKAEELRKAKEAAEAASLAKNDFMANVSHEIRTPLNGVMGLAEILLDTPLDGQQREYLRLIQSSANTLMALISDLLDFSRLEASRLSFEATAFGLRQALEPTLRTLGFHAVEKGLVFTWTVDPEVPEQVFGDPLRLQQIFLHLVGNAIKFTAKGEIDVRLGLAARTADKVTLRGVVRDTGIGIPWDKQEVIFEAFCQADNSPARKYGGTGLGLTIASRLIGMLGGRIHVDSTPGKGSAFHFDITLQLTAGGATGSAGAPAPGSPEDGPARIAPAPPAEGH